MTAVVETSGLDLTSVVEEHLPLVKHVVFQVAVHFPRHVDREELARAAKLEAQANLKREQADDQLKAQRDKTIEDQKQARADKEQEIQGARQDAEERKRAAAEDTKNQVAAAKKRLDAMK